MLRSLVGSEMCIRDRNKYSTSERLACELVGLSRAAYRYMPLPKDDEEPLRAEVIRMASTYGRYGYRFIAGMMRNSGWLTLF